LRLGGLAAWFDVRKLHGVRLFAFTHFLGRANQICCAAQSGLGHSAHSPAFAPFLLGEFIVVLLL
jgi:hypothetical protein